MARNDDITETVLWRNVFGDPVDLDNIDKTYALNILTMVLLSRGRYYDAYTQEDIRDDELVQKLRDVVLNGRDKNYVDRLRAISYNARCKLKGLRFRAPVL